MTTGEGTGLAQAEQTEEDITGALVGRLFEAALGAVDMVSVYLGDRLGLYRALAEAGASCMGSASWSACPPGSRSSRQRLPAR